MRRTLTLAALAVATLSSVTIRPTATAYAATYPTNVCVSQKQSAAATACQQILVAWMKWENDPAKDPGNTTRDGAITKATGKYAAAWSKAEQTATTKGVDCADTTASSSSLQDSITAAVSDIVTTINTGVDFTNKADRTCRAKLIKGAATACANLLKAESKFVKGLKRDPGGAKRDAATSKALGTFNAAWTNAACPGTGTADAVTTTLTTLDGTIVADTTVSPNVAGTWTMITPAAPVEYNGKALMPVCSDGSQYVYFVKKGTGSGVNKLLVYYYGGGACWDYLTCTNHTETPTTGPQDNPGAQSTQGLGDLTNPANPFANWSMVAVPYCTGDVHWGNATATYTDPSDSSKSITIQHRGWVNAQVVEKWTREHFVNPDVLFVAGSSAGGYGALLNGLYFLQNVYQASKAYIFDDAGAGVITPAFQDTNLAQWGVDSTLPKWIPGIKGKHLSDINTSEVGIDAANFYPRTDFVQYTTSYDQTQTLFYNIMVFGDAGSQGFQWWLSTCDWNAKMLTNLTAATAANYRYYVGAGSRHTVWGSNKVYTDTTGGVPLLIDWINAMLAGDAAWTNVKCTNCNLLAGDPRPNPLVTPFSANGVVTCP